MIKKRIMKKGTAMLLAATLSITGMNAIPNRAHAEETVANVNYNYGDVEQYSASSSKPEENDLVGTAKFDMQANGWSMNENGQWIKADINGTGVYSVTNVFDEVQDDPQAYACIRISSLDQYASYIDFKNVTVWFDGKVTNIPCVRGKDGDCRIQLWNAWADYPASEQVPDKFREIKVQFTLEIRDTPIDWETQGTDPSLITMKNAENYLPAWKTLSELSGTAQLDMQANEWCEGEDGQWIKAEIDGTGVYSVTNIFDEVQDDPQAYASVRISDLDPYAAYIDFKDVTVWFDGKEVNIPCVRGTEGDCRLQLWNTWNEQPVDENVPEEFREIKVQFTLAIRDTAIDWETEGNDPSLVTMVDAEDYVPEWKSEPEETAKPTQSIEPTEDPVVTTEPTEDPVVTIEPTVDPTATTEPTREPTMTETPTQGPSKMPAPTVSPSAVPSVTPSARPSAVPSVTPIVTQNPGTGNEADDALEVEDSFVAGDFEYEVTKVAEGSKKGQVKVVGLLESGESKKTISVPNEVTGTDALKYQVTGIGERAFAGEKVQEVVLGKYVTRIESRAFAKCKKLKVLTCKAKLQTVQKNAFKKCTNKIRVSGKAKKANIKLLKKSGYKKFK